MKDRTISQSDEMDYAIAQTAARWLREHGYFVAWDGNAGCYRVVEEGIDRKDDKPHTTEFKTVQAAYSRAFRLIAGEAKLPR